MPRNRKVLRERRVGVDVTWADLADVEVHRRVTSCARTVMDCARVLPFDEALAGADSALRHGRVTKQKLLEAADLVPRRYRAACRRLVLEAESFEHHGSRKALLRDCERYNLRGRHGWTVLRFGWEHVMLDQPYVVECLSAFAARPQPHGRAVSGATCAVPA